MSKLGMAQYNPRKDDVVLHPADYMRLRAIETAAKAVVRICTDQRGNLFVSLLANFDEDLPEKMAELRNALEQK